MAKIGCLQGAIRRLIAERQALREYDCGPGTSRRTASSSPVGNGSPMR